MLCVVGKGVLLPLIVHPTSPTRSDKGQQTLYERKKENDDKIKKRKSSIRRIHSASPDLSKGKKKNTNALRYDMTERNGD